MHDIDEILRALDHYQGDPFFSQQYAALLQEQISKGLDLLLKKDIPSKSMLFRYLILLYIDLLHTKRIFVALEYFSNSKKLPQLEYLATDLGYSSAHYFYCVFKRYVGLTPSEVWHLMSA